MKRMTKKRIAELNAKIKEIDAAIQATPVTRTQGSVTYQALWHYRDTLIRELAGAERES